MLVKEQNSIYESDFFRGSCSSYFKEVKHKIESHGSLMRKACNVAIYWLHGSSLFFENASINGSARWTMTILYELFSKALCMYEEASHSFIDFHLLFTLSCCIHLKRKVTAKHWKCLVAYPRTANAKSVFWGLIWITADVRGSRDIVHHFYTSNTKELQRPLSSFVWNWL